MYYTLPMAMGDLVWRQGVIFALLWIGYFEGIDSERGIACRAADSFALRDCLGVRLEDALRDHSTISGTRRLIDLETHRAVSSRSCPVAKSLGRRDFQRFRTRNPGHACGLLLM